MPKYDDTFFEFVRERSAEIIDLKSLRHKMAGGKRLRVKLGIDANKPDLHLGHVVPLRMLKAFQDAGHRAVLIIGDYTAMIGDPSGRTTARSMVSAREVKANERTFLRQLGKILDLKKIEVRHNSDWYASMKLARFLGLLTQFSLKSAWEREDFQQRLKKGKPVQLNEAMYHVLQGYDSVMVSADVELGAIDQKLNILAGRELQSRLGKAPQDIVLLPYLIGLDGSQKMSKSVGNVINLEDAPGMMFGKVMAIPDTLILNYAELAAWLPGRDVTRLAERLKAENPRDVKLDLAEAISALYHGRVMASNARTLFMRTFSQRDASGQAVLVSLVRGHYRSLELLGALHVAPSKSEARRLLAGGAVEVDGRRLLSVESAVEIRSGSIIRVGKRKFFRVR